MSTSLHISLPDPLRQWVEKQAAAEGYRTPGEYVRDLLRREQLHEGRAGVDAHLLAALDSGEPTEMTKQDWEDIRQEGRRLAKSDPG